MLRMAHIEGKVSDPALGTKLEKSVFVVFFAGERARSKILKLCEAVGANRYPFPEDRSRQRQMNAEVGATDLSLLLNMFGVSNNKRPVQAVDALATA
eukprot:4666847-Pyramimonas_sp.AAC.1